MKTLMTFISICSITILGAMAQSADDPGAYMSDISSQYHQVAKDQWSYTRLVARGKGARRVENKRQNLIESMKSAELAVKQMNAYREDESLRDSVESYFRLAHIVLKEDYGKIMDMEEVAEQSYDAMEALILAREKASDKLERANKRVMKTQEHFAKRHGVTLSESSDELYANLDKAGEVFDYYNAVYLIFFKSHKQEGYMVEAMNREDVNAMEQNKTALLSVSQEGLEKLKEHKHYASDPQLRMACERMLEFHEKEAEEQMPIVINFYVQKANFEKVAANMEGKKKRDVTQEDVDKYNKATNAFNSAVNEFNAVNDKMNETRSKLLEDWNEKVDRFLDRHVPS